MANSLRKYRWAAVLPLVVSGILLQSCGGGGVAPGGSGGSSGGSSGGGTTGGTTGGPGLGQLAVTAQLPPGYTGNKSALSLSGGLTDKTALNGSLSATIPSWNTARQLVAVLDAGNTPVLMGFVGPGHAKLTTRTTADVLAYFSIAGYLAPVENQEQLLQSIETSKGGDAVALAIANDLKASPNGLVNPGATFRPKLTTLTQTLLGLKGIPSKVDISPFPGAKSGVTINYGADAHQILGQNTFHRRALMFVDRISTVDASGNETPSFARVATVEVPPAKGTVYGNDLYGNLGNLPDTASTASTTLPDVAGTASKVKYTVAVAGPGTSAGDSYVLSASEESDLKKLLKKTFFVDFLVPALGRVLVANTLEHLSVSGQKLFFDEMVSAADSQETAITAFVDQYFPQAETAIENGDYSGALSQVIDGTWKSPAATNAIAQFFANFLKQIPDFPGKPDGSRFSLVMTWVNKAIAFQSSNQVVSGALSNLPQGRDYSQASKMATWDVEVNKAKLTFTPVTSTINSSGTNTFAKLTANVTDLGSLPKGTTVSYKFTTTANHGSLSLGGGGGQTSITTNQKFIYYSSNVGVAATYGTDTVTVQVMLDHGGGNLENVGAANAKVKVKAQSDIELTPVNQSVKPNQASQVIVAKTHYPDLISSGELQLQWSVKNGLGTLNADSKPGQQDSVIFTAGSKEGLETVQCAIIETATGKTLNTATADVKIEAKTSIEFGSIWAGGGITENDANGCSGGGGVGITIPKVAGAKSYSVHCYNFDDTAYFGTDIYRSCDATGVGADDDLDGTGKDLHTKGANGSFFFGLTGGVFFGPGPCGNPPPDPLAGAQDSARSRFAGMIIEVTVTY